MLAAVGKGGKEMEKTRLQEQSERYPHYGRVFRVALGIFDLALCLYFCGFIVYQIIRGDTAHLAQVCGAVVATLPSGLLLLRSASSKEDSLRRASRDLLP